VIIFPSVQLEMVNLEQPNKDNLWKHPQTGSLCQLDVLDICYLSEEIMQRHHSLTSV
jgi:hypothetical protein